MTELIIVPRDNGSVLITIDDSPVNALCPGVPESIAAAIEQLDKADDLKALVVIGVGCTFLAGAHIKEFVEDTDARFLTGRRLGLESAKKNWARRSSTPLSSMRLERTFADFEREKWERVVAAEDLRM